MKENRRRKKFIGTPFQKKILLLVFVAMIVPAGIIAFCLYYLIFNLLAWQLGIPENVAYNLLPVAHRVNLIILIALPITLLVIWRIALELSHRIAGPLYRLEKELDERLVFDKKGPIQVRQKDELSSLAKKINKLIAKYGGGPCS